jgi:hypothetical protein
MDIPEIKLKQDRSLTHLSVQDRQKFLRLVELFLGGYSINTLCVQSVGNFIQTGSITKQKLAFILADIHKAEKQKQEEMFYQIFEKGQFYTVNLKLFDKNKQREIYSFKNTENQTFKVKVFATDELKLAEGQWIKMTLSPCLINYNMSVIYISHETYSFTLL